MGLLPPDPTAPEPFESLQAELRQPDGPKVRRDLAPGHVESDSRAAGSAPISAFMEESIDDDTQKFISQSLTDVDLFASYGLTQKAIGLLEAILRRAPSHTPTLEKLLDFVLGAGDDRRTAELAAHLERIHRERGDASGAERFGELRRRFQRAAGLSDEEIAAAANPSGAHSAVEVEEEVAEEENLQELPAAPEAPPMPPPKPTVTKAPVHEVDLSDEWASL